MTSICLGCGREKPLTFAFSLTCSVDFLMFSPHIWAVFLALIPPSFKSLGPFEKFFRLSQPHLAVTTGDLYENPGSAPTFPVIYKKMQSRETSRAHEIKSPLNE